MFWLVEPIIPDEEGYGERRGLGERRYLVGQLFWKDVLIGRTYVGYNGWSGPSPVEVATYQKWKIGEHHYLIGRLFWSGVLIGRTYNPRTWGLCERRFLVG